MGLEYKVIEIFTREGERRRGLPVHEAVLKLIADRGSPARASVVRALGGVFEGGETVSHRAVELSSDLPVKIEIILPAADLAEVLPALDAMVSDGMIVVRDASVVVHRTGRRPLPRGLRVHHVMTAEPLYVSPLTPVHDVVHLLAEHEFNSVPVVDDGAVIGIISQGDLLSRAGMPLRVGLFAEYDRLERERRLPSGSRPAGEIMSSPAVTVEVDRLLEDATRLMVERELKRLPVVDREGGLRGMLSRIDVLKVFGSHVSRRAGDRTQPTDAAWPSRVGDLTLHDIPAVGPDSPLTEVLDLFDAESRRVVVLDAEGRMVGLISDRDLLEALGRRQRGMLEYVRRSLGGRMGRAHRRHERALRALSAADVMRVDLVTVGEDEHLDRALSLMTSHRLKRLPVISSGGVFVGVLSRDGVLRTGSTMGRTADDVEDGGTVAAEDGG